jgi:feruloyl esterase
MPAASAQSTISEALCSPARLGTTIPVSAIGEPVSAVTLEPPVWTAASGELAAYCSVDGAMAPVDRADTARPILFRVVLPEVWNGRSAQLGGGGMNGTIPNLVGGAGSPFARGFATYGSDSGHQAAQGPGRGRGGARGGGRGGPPTAPDPAADRWTLNEEAIRNLGYMQMKKTHDAAMVLVDRMYGVGPEYNYFIGNSQGGREALVVASRYGGDYDGVAASVPIVGFSSLMLAPELIRIQEKPLANRVTTARVNAIRGEFMRQCDGMDGLTDGVIQNYVDCRERFDVGDGAGPVDPWSGKRCPNDVDPNPEDTSPEACLTEGQISTLEFVYSRYRFASPLAHLVESFGMWVPNTDPSGSGLIATTRFRGQEGAGDDAPLHSHLGVLGVTGFLMQDLGANPLDYVEGGPLQARRLILSEYLDGSDPDFSEFMARGGRMIVTIGTNDTLASPGAQMDFYQSVIDTMGQDAVDEFARFFVLPQTGHGLSGMSYALDGDGNERAPVSIPNQYDRLGVLTDWVERGVVPARSLTVTSGERSLPMCSYPEYPRYEEGPVDSSASYRCTRP